MATIQRSSDASPAPVARASKRRDALLKAGLSLFADRPVDAVSVDELVAAAGVAKGTFFNHFADKHAFAGAIASDIRSQIERLVTRANKDISDPMQRLANGMRVAGQFAQDNRLQTLLLLRTSGVFLGQDHPLNAGVARDIEDAVKTRAARPEAARQGVLCWLSLCQGLMARLASETHSPQSASRATEEMIAIGLAGIAHQS